MTKGGDPGSAGIRKRGNGGWRARYRGPDGRERQKTFATYNLARSWRQSQVADVQRGEHIGPSRQKMLYGEWADKWIESIREDVKPQTLASYRSLLRTHVEPKWGKRRMSTIETVEIKNWLGGLSRTGWKGLDENGHNSAKKGGPLSASQVRKIRQVLFASFEAAVTDGYVARNPAEKTSVRPDPKRPARVLTGAQVASLAEAIDPRYQTLIYLLAYTGIRRGEAAALRRSKVDLANRHIVVDASVVELYDPDAPKSKVGATSGMITGTTKTGSRREVPLPQFLAAMLTEHILGLPASDADPLMFTAPGGKELRTSWNGRYFKPALVAAGIDPAFRIHDLRHTAASLLISIEPNLKKISEWLGHSQISITMDTYGHMLEGSLDDMADGLDAMFEEASGP